MPHIVVRLRCFPVVVDELLAVDARPDNAPGQCHRVLFNIRQSVVPFGRHPSTATPASVTRPESRHVLPPLGHRSLTGPVLLVESGVFSARPSSTDATPL